jgi:hypothetical protein
MHIDAKVYCTLEHDNTWRIGMHLTDKCLLCSHSENKTLFTKMSINGSIERFENGAQTITDSHDKQRQRIATQDRPRPAAAGAAAAAATAAAFAMEVGLCNGPVSGSLQLLNQ